MRGTGTTTQQIKAAPKGALYVCESHGVAYFIQEKAKSLGREDLIFASADALEDPQSVSGYSFTAIVVDHAVQGTKERHNGLAKLVCAYRLNRTATDIYKNSQFRELHESIANTPGVFSTSSRHRKISVTVGINTNQYVAEEYAVGPDGTLVLTTGGKEVYRFAAYCWQAVGYDQS